METIRFEKKGFEFEISINETNCTANITHANITAQVYTLNSKRHGCWIYIVTDSKIISKLSSGNHYDLQIGHESAEKVHNLLQKLQQEKKEELLKKAKTLKIVGLEYTIGCDAANDYSFIYNDNSDPKIVSERRALDSQLLEEIKKLNLSELGENWGAEELESTMMTYGGYIFNQEQIQIILEMVHKNNQKEKNEKIKAENNQKEKISKLIQKAKETNEPQLYSTYMDDCNDPEEDCSFDSINIYIDSEGNYTERRFHCH